MTKPPSDHTLRMLSQIEEECQHFDRSRLTLISLSYGLSNHYNMIEEENPPCLVREAFNNLYEVAFDLESGCYLGEEAARETEAIQKLLESIKAARAG